MSDISKQTHGGSPSGDAQGQFAPSQADRKADGVASAKPTHITGSEDATAHKMPPGKDTPSKEWDANFDIGDHSAHS